MKEKLLAVIAGLLNWFTIFVVNTSFIVKKTV